MYEQLMAQGSEWLRQRRLQQALLCFNRVVLSEPGHRDALLHCADVLFELNRPAEAVVYVQQALQLASDTVALSLYAKALYQMGQYYEALGYFERIIACEPDNYVAVGQRALCLTQCNRHEDALLAYQQALAACNYQDPWIQYNYSLCLLTMGRLLPGFQHFEYRWLSALQKNRRDWILPETVSRELLYGKSMLIHAEQGLGDSIHFFRYIPLLVQLGVRVYLEIQPALIPLLSVWRHSIQLIATGAPLPTCDYYCPMMSLARLFKTEMPTIPCSVPYVFPIAQAVEACRAMLGQTNRKRIGIVWKGSAHHPLNQQRSLALTALLGMQQGNLDFICLQKDVTLPEKKLLDQHHIPYYGLELSTMHDTAALIACLDVIISVDTSIAHLAAAMGKTVWIVLPFNADWRWFLQQNDSPWYPGVTLFRQETCGDWTIPLAQVKTALANLHAMQNEPSHRQQLINNPTAHAIAQTIALTALQEHRMADAIQFMQQAVEIAPDITSYRRNLGELLCRAGQLEAAIASHQRLIAIEPDHAENHFLLALAYNNNGQFPLAIHHYRIALSFDKDYGLAWNNLGASLESSGDKQQAENAYATAIALNPQHAEAQNNLAALYSEAGRIDEARLHFEAAIAAKPDFIEAHYNLSLVKTYTKTDPHLDFLHSIEATITHYPLQTRIHYYFALGKALDDTQNYAAAFAAYAEGNRLHYLERPWNNRILQHFVAQIPAVFTPAFLHANTPHSDSETRCPIFVVGMPRAGTTLIEQILCSHAQIYGAGELSILDDVIQSACRAAGLPLMQWISQLTDQDCRALGEKYLEQTWMLAPDKHFIIDKMPSNCFYIGMIHRMLPQAKIIHAMRDPMDSCFSCFTHLFKTTMWFAYDLDALGDYYQWYAQTMQYWHHVLPGKIFDLPYEHMVNQHEVMTQRLLDYIGLPWDPNCLNFYTSKRVIKTASLVQVRKPVYTTSIARWQHFNQQLQPLLQRIGMHTALYYSNLCEIYRRANLLTLSIQSGEKAIALAPRLAIAWSNSGIAYYDAKQYKQAENCHRQALAIDPQLSASLNNLGSIYLACDNQSEAITCYQAAIASAPQSAGPLNNLGFALLSLEHYDAALKHFNQALQLQSDYAEAWYGIAKVHLQRHQFIEAETAARRAIGLKPQQVEWHQLLAEIYQEQGLYDQALHCLDHLNDPFCLAKGRILMEMGEIDAAEHCFLTSATAKDIDTQVLAQYSLVQLRKVKPESARLKQLQSLINQPELSKREYAYFALGKCYDDLGEWAQAFAYFSQGCQIKRARITYHTAEQMAFTYQLTQRYTRQTIEALRAFANPSALPVFIVGMPRSGTSLVEQIISAHSQVYGAGELKYLPELMQRLPIVDSPAIGQAITENYLTCLQRFSSDAKRITDKMPQNFIAIGLIHALFPNAKIIHVSRNPLDTCLSCYTKLFTQGHAYSYDLTELGHYYQSYEHIMQHWRQTLPSNAWLDLRYETLVNHFDEEVKRLLDFCELAWEPECLAFHQTKRLVRTASFAQVRQPVYTASIERWRRYEQELAPLIETLHQSPSLIKKRSLDAALA